MINHTTIKIAHVINPFNCLPNNQSYLYYAQPITFQSMYESQKFASSFGINVELYAINYKEDDEIVPPFFKKLPNLKKSTKSIFPDISENRKLPILDEILNITKQHTKADYIIFSNSDIALQKHFYVQIYNFITKDKLNSIVINRRDNLPKFKNGFRLTKDNLNLLYKEKGEPHKGKDCFIIHKKLIEKINLGNLFIGYPPWGYTLHTILKKLDTKNKIFKNLYLTFHIGNDKKWTEKYSLLWEKNKQISNQILKKYN